MKNIIALCIVFVLGPIGYSQSSQILNRHSDIGGDQVFHEMLPIKHTQYQYVITDSGEIYFRSKLNKDDSNGLASSSHFPPSLLSSPNVDKWTELWFSGPKSHGKIASTKTPSAPEPATMLLLGIGLTGIAMIARKKIK